MTTTLLGYAASCAVLATFLMRTMVSLRLVSILSNVLFVAFAYLEHIYPVLLLHAVLLPINLWRLRELQQAPRAVRAYDEGGERREQLSDDVLAGLSPAQQNIREPAKQAHLNYGS
jgi:hypothetical protein